MLLLILLDYCSISEKHMGNNFYHQTSGMPYIEGKTEYLTSPFVTAGDRVYMVGYQDGSFPDLVVRWEESGIILLNSWMDSVQK